MLVRLLFVLTLLVLTTALPTSINQWSSEDVTVWLSSIGLAEYNNNFLTEAIDGDVLLELSEAELKSSLNVQKLGHRKKIALEIAKLKADDQSSINQSIKQSIKQSIESDEVIQQEIPVHPSHKSQQTKSKSNPVQSKQSINQPPPPSSASDFEAASHAAKSNKPNPKKVSRKSIPNKQSIKSRSAPYLQRSKSSKVVNEVDKERVRELLRDALVVHQQGQLESARALYEQALTIDPSNSRALHMLSLVIMIADNDINTAIKMIERSISIESEPDAHVNLGNFYWQQGLNEEAIEQWQIALSDSFLAGGPALRSRYAETVYSMSLQSYNDGKVEKCKELMIKALRLTHEAELINYPSNHSPAWYIANAEQSRQSHLDIIHSIRMTMIDSWLHLGLLADQNGQSALALECYNRGLLVEPTSLDALKPENGKINTIRNEIVGYRSALLEHFVPEKQSMARAAKTADGMLVDRTSSSHKKMVEYLHKSCHFNSAAELVTQIKDDVIFKSPHYPFLYESESSIEAARSRYDKMLDDVIADRSLAAIYPQPMGLEWARFRFYLAYHGLNNREMNEKLVKAYLHLAPSLSYTSKQLVKWNGHRKIRVGFVSAFMTAHPVGRTLQGYIQHLPRDLFEVVVLFITLQPNVENDPLLLQMQEWADEFLTLPVEHTTRIREIVESAKLDALIYGDIGMEPTTYFMAFSRLAPVQALTFGHPDTSGLKTIDYFISHKGFDQEGAKGQAYYTEKLVSLDGVGYWHQSELPERYLTRSDVGLSQEQLGFNTIDDNTEPYTMYLVTKSVQFYSPAFIDALAQILARNPRSFVALLIDSGKQSRGFELHNQCQESVLDWVEARLKHYTTHPSDALPLSANLSSLVPDRQSVSGRVRFLDKGDNSYFMSLLHMTDVLLQPMPLDGTTTSLEALSIATPTVIMQSATVGGRMGSSMYQYIGVTDNVATTQAEYIDIAVRLGQDREFNQALRAKVRAASESKKLYRNPEAVTVFGNWLRQAVQAANA